MTSLDSFRDGSRTPHACSLETATPLTPGWPDHKRLPISITTPEARSWTRSVALVLSFAALALACAPEVGSNAWCAKMKETPKGDWSANDAAAYAKNCIFD